MDIKKRKVNHVAAVGIVYGGSGKIFAEVKTADYPRKIFANKGLIIGGNWIGPRAITDMGPKDTLVREWGEEITFDKPVVSYEELNRLLSEDRLDTYQMKASDWKPSAMDQSKLDHLKWAVLKSYCPFGDFEFFVPEEVFKREEPDYTKGGIRGIVSVWQAGLASVDWDILVELQQKSGNLSNESQSIITSLDEILRTGLQIGWGEDRMLRSFFLSKGFREALDFPLIPDIDVKYCGSPLATYEDYLKFYDIDKRP